jgi:hypothetical protein
MYKFLFSLLLCGAISATTGAQPVNLAGIPEELKNKASVIVHLDNTEIEVESLDKATVKVHRIYTVLNEDGKSDLRFSEYTTRFISLEDAEIKVYDASGKQVARYKKKDLNMISTGEGLIEDGYMVYYRIQALSYPVTVDVKYEQKLKSTLFLPDFRFIAPKQAIVEANFSVKIPNTISLRFKAKNTTVQPEVTDDGKDKFYKWTVKNLSPIEYEEGSVAARDRYPQVIVVTDQFSHYGYKGDLSTWKTFGSWIRDLYNGLDVLPPERQQFFAGLVKDAPNEREKIRRVYDYLQHNFRYVSIQLGIGGLQPFSADFTDKKKYGDCKGLSNYMKAALKCVGIKSYIAIINAEYNSEPVDPGFPANEFNHVIVCVPNQPDSIWLECTSSSAEFGVLGTFTENRNALLITDDGGILVQTPKSRADENTISSVTTVAMEDDLSALAETKFRTKGAFSELVNEIVKDNKDDQKMAIVNYFGYKQPDDFLLEKDEKDPSNFVLKLAIAKVPEFNAGNKLFISPRMYKIWSRALPKAENRKLDFYFRYPFVKDDTTIYKFPSSMHPDVLPKETVMRCDYADYRTKYWYNEKENAIYAATRFKLTQHKIPVSDYPTVKKFFDDLAQDDAQKFVIQKSAGEKKAF